MLPRDGQVTSTGTLGAPESCMIWAKRYTAFSYRLLNPWMKTRTLRSFAFAAWVLIQVSAVYLETTSAPSTAKSVSGLGGNLFGHWTSPSLRRGGIDIVISAKDGCSA